MRIRILSDGTGNGTRVVDERGQRVEMVTKIEWQVEVKGLATAVLTFARVPVEVSGELEEGDELERTLLPEE